MRVNNRGSHVVNLSLEVGLEVSLANGFTGVFSFALLKMLGAFYELLIAGRSVYI